MPSLQDAIVARQLEREQLLVRRQELDARLVVLDAELAALTSVDGSTPTQAAPAAETPVQAAPAPRQRPTRSDSALEWVLDWVCRTENGWLTAPEGARATGLHQSTISRSLRLLEAQGMVVWHGKSKFNRRVHLYRRADTGDPIRPQEGVEHAEVPAGDGGPATA